MIFDQINNQNKKRRIKITKRKINKYTTAQSQFTSHQNFLNHIKIKGRREV